MGLNGIGRGNELKGTPLDGKSPRDVLRDPNVAVDRLRHRSRRVRRRGRHFFDVYVQAVNATSLERRHAVDDRVATGPGEHVGQVQPQKLAESRGPVFVNPFIDPTKMTRTSGRILNGGLVTSPFKVEIRLDNESHAVVRSMVSSINSRFPEGAGDREPTAIGRTGSSIAVRVPAAYRTSRRFLDLLRAVRVDDRTPIEDVVRRYVDGFKNQPGLSNEFSLCLEALGPKVLPFIRDLYDYSELGPQFGALRAGAKLGRGAGGRVPQEDGEGGESADPAAGDRTLGGTRTRAPRSTWRCVRSSRNRTICSSVWRRMKAWPSGRRRRCWPGSCGNSGSVRTIWRSRFPLRISKPDRNLCFRAGDCRGSHVCRSGAKSGVRSSWTSCHSASPWSM